MTGSITIHNVRDHWPYSIKSSDLYHWSNLKLDINAIDYRLDNIESKRHYGRPEHRRDATEQLNKAHTDR